MSRPGDPGNSQRPASSQIDTGQSTSYDVIVIGSLVADISCFYQPLDNADKSQTQPISGSSNAARISQCVGGVAHNIALSLHYLGQKPLLMSVVAEDAAGDLLLAELDKSDLSIEGILRLPASAESRTSVYVGNYDTSKNLLFGMADVSLMNQLDEVGNIDPWLSLISTHRPKCVILDLCFPHPILNSILLITRHHSIPLIIEPVSVPRATKLMQIPSLVSQSNLFPRSPYYLITPNDTELAAMHQAFLDSPLSSALQSHSRYNRIQEAITQATSQLNASPWPDDFKAVATQALALLPIFPAIAVTFGSNGCFYCSLAYEEAPADALSSSQHHHQPPPPSSSSSKALASTAATKASDTASITTTDSTMSRNRSSHRACVVRVEHYPVPRKLKPEDIVSVNGAGDSFVAGWVAAMLLLQQKQHDKNHYDTGSSNARRRSDAHEEDDKAAETGPGGRQQDTKHLASAAQRAALMTLRDERAVSSKLKNLKILGGMTSSTGSGGNNDKKTQRDDDDDGKSTTSSRRDPTQSNNNNNLSQQRTEEANVSLASVDKRLAGLVSHDDSGRQEEEKGRAGMDSRQTATENKENEALAALESVPCNDDSKKEMAPGVHNTATAEIKEAT